MKLSYFLFFIGGLILHAQSDSVKALTKDSINYYLSNALIHIEDQRIEQATELLSKADAIVEDNPEYNSIEYRAFSHYIRALSFFLIAEFDRMINEINHTIKLAEESKDFKLKGTSHVMLATYYFGIGDKAASERYLNLALKLLEEKATDGDNSIDPFSINEHKIDIYYNLIKLKHDDLLDVYLENNLANDINREETYNSILFNGHQLLNLFSITNKKSNRKPFIFTAIANAYTGLNELELAKNYIDSTKNVLSKSNFSHKQMYHIAESNYYSKVQDFQSALESFKQAYVYNNYLRDETIERFQSRLKDDIGSINKGLQGKLLKTQLDIERLQKVRLIAIISATVLIMLCLVVFLLFQNKMIALQERHNNQLSITNSKLKTIINDKLELEAKIDNIQSIVATDLHDNFGNRLSRILASNEILNELRLKNDTNSPTFWKFLEHLHQNTNQLIFDIKDLLWSNNPKNNSLSQIIYRLETAVSDLSLSDDIDISFESNYNKDLKFPQLWNRQILLTFKEAVNNAIKYSEAKQIQTGLIVEKDKIYLYVKDDGKGFTVNDVKTSGILNMKKRANSIDCELKIKSELNKGTIVELSGKLNLV